MFSAGVDGSNNLVIEFRILFIRQITLDLNRQLLNLMQKLFDFVLIFDLCKAQPLVDQRDVRRAALLANVNMRCRLSWRSDKAS